MIIELRGVGKRYGRRAAGVLRQIDLEIDSGDVVGLVGPNGSGKSTLLRIIAGVSRVSEGTVTGNPSVGYLPDRFPSALRMSGLAYLRHMGRLSGLSTMDAERRATQWLDRLGLAGNPRAPLGELSKGNAQKVGLAQAVLAEPDLLVLDEPWSGLDATAYEVLGEIIPETRRRGASVIFTQHRAGPARAHAGELLRLTDGRLRAVAVGAESGACTRVVLRGPGSGAWASEPGVTESREDGDRMVLTVAAEWCDEVLTVALSRGWSVLAVVPLSGTVPR